MDPIKVLLQGTESYAPYFQTSGELNDPVFGEPTQYGTAYYALCNAVLAAKADHVHLQDYARRALAGVKAAVHHVASSHEPPTASGFRRDTGEVLRFNHRDFFWPAILSTVRILLNLNVHDLRSVLNDIIAVNIDQSFDSRPPSNVASVWLLGEWLRFQQGLSPYRLTQFEKWLELYFAERILAAYGFYEEPGFSNSYDLFTRYHLASILAEGYFGVWRRALAELFRTGLKRSLDIQLSDGSLASAHRSSGQTWTVGAQCAFFALAAQYFRSDPVLAEQASEAALRALSSLRRWQRSKGPFSPVENCLPADHRVGYEIYTADGHYGPLALSFLGNAILTGLADYVSEAGNRRSPLTRVEHDPIYRAIAHHSCYSVHLNACPAPKYDGLGIVDLTFGLDRYLHFVSTVRHVESGNLFNLGLAQRNQPGLSSLTVLAQQSPVHVISLEENTLQVGLQMHVRPQGSPHTYRVVVTLDENGVRVYEGTPNLKNYKTLLIPYLHDPGTGVITQVSTGNGYVQLAHSHETVRIAFDLPVEHIVHISSGYESRRGLCGLIRVDFQDPSDAINYTVSILS